MKNHIKDGLVIFNLILAAIIMVAVIFYGVKLKLLVDNVKDNFNDVPSAPTCYIDPDGNEYCE